MRVHILPLGSTTVAQVAFPRWKAMVSSLSTYSSTRKDFLVDEYVESDETMAFHRGNATWATVVLPKGSMWTLIHTDEIEFPSLESITRQTKTDQDHLLALEKELYPQ